ncbi:hypothetical protein K1719_018350 [Acacia pycnantha]|nr:hypothetical protein K1719_018350 [Acacia pycnantha]
MEKLKNDFYRAIMEGRWPKVYDMLKTDRWLFMVKVTVIEEDTVLHMAMYTPEKMKPVVAAMVDLVREDEESSERANILGATNLKGDTPLHLAASIGNLEMCKMIGETDCSLILRRNHEGETPLFTAVLYGQRDAFLWLHYCLYGDNPAVSSIHCVRNNNDTILHCAIAQDRFDMAIEIFYLYDDLVDPMRLNDKGLSPLHLLAEKPSAFYSGTLLGQPFGYFAYHVLLCGDKKKKKATTKAELMERERKSCVNQWMIGRIPDKYLQNLTKNLTKAKQTVKSIIWALGQFELAGQPINELVGVHGVRKKKEKHAWSRQIMEKLLERYSDSFLKPSPTQEVHNDPPLLIAAKNGVIEMVKMIVEEFQLTVDIGAVNEEGKNIVLLAAENRQTDVYEYLRRPEIRALTRSLFKQVDKEENSALHLTARYRDDHNLKLQREVLIMQWEYKWFKYVENSMPPGVFATYNKKGETPFEIFSGTHKDTIETDKKWLTKTANACSLVSTLIATVAFATAATVPGSFNQDPDHPTKNGFPVFLHKKVYQLFVGMSLAALLFSLIATILLLSIVTARYHIDFFTNLPSRLFLGMSSMFISIICMWASFCSGHSFLLVQHARNVYIPVYILASIAGTIFAITKFPVYWNLLSSSFYKTPVRSYNVVPARPNLAGKKLTCAETLNRLVKICEDYEK